MISIYQVYLFNCRIFLQGKSSKTLKSMSKKKTRS